MRAAQIVLLPLREKVAGEARRMRGDGLSFAPLASRLPADASPPSSDPASRGHLLPRGEKERAVSGGRR